MNSWMLNGGRLLRVAVIVLAGWWIYWPALYGGWLWDDNLYITENPLLRDPARLWKAWFEPGSFIEYYPIEQTVQWTQWQLWHNDTLGYHLTNVVLHLLSALLVWKLLGKFGLRFAWLGGLIFAIHPVAVESVAWISELKNTLSLPPFLLAMCVWVDYEEHGRKRDYAMALGWFLTAMLCKITMALFPVVILLYAWWKRGHLGWNDLRSSAPFFIISLTLGVTAILAGDRYEHLHHGASVILSGGFFSRLALAGSALSFYFFKCLWPVGLLPIYPQWKVDPPSFLQFLPGPILGGVIYGLWNQRRGWGRHALLGLGFFVLNLAPFLGFMTISYMRFTWVMDHFLYLPILGLIGLATAALGWARERISSSSRPWGMGMIAGILGLLAWESHGYASLYVNQETLWTYTLQRNPDASVAHYNLGLVLSEKGRLSEAMDQYEQALRINPDYANAHSNLGNVLLLSGHFSEAIDQCEQALKIDPYHAQAHNSLGDALLQTGRVGEAIEQFQAALQINPDSGQAHNNLGSALLRMGHGPEAMVQLEAALRINPNDANAHYNFGNALAQAGRRSEAREHYEQTVRIDPSFAAARKSLGVILLQAGQFSEAADQFEAVLQANPSDVDAPYNLGVALAGMGRIPEAIGEFERALQIAPHDADARNNLLKLQNLQKAPPIKKKTSK